jgi:hypothetical protein
MPVIMNVLLALSILQIGSHPRPNGLPQRLLKQLAIEKQAKAARQTQLDITFLAKH